MKKLPFHHSGNCCPMGHTETEAAPRKLISKELRIRTAIWGGLFAIFAFGFLVNLIRGDLNLKDFDSWFALIVVIVLFVGFICRLKKLIKYEGKYRHCIYCKKCDEIWYDPN